MVVGVTGKYCAGKNIVSELFVRSGFHVVDVDRLGHRALEENRREVSERFGPSILSPDGTIDRGQLGRIVFADAAALRTLEETVHPSMVRHVREEIEREPDKNFVINAAILFRMGLHELCDKVVWVEAPFALRLRRAMRRDKLSLLQIVRRMWSQRKLSPQPYRNLVDIYTVRNSGDKQGIEAGVLSLVKMVEN